MCRKYNISDEDYRMIELLMIERKSHKTGPQWKFAGSFYYALVTLALIGWVNSSYSSYKYLGSTVTTDKGCTPAFIDMATRRPPPTWGR